MRAIQPKLPIQALPSGALAIENTVFENQPSSVVNRH
jgi:hypothetical protein